MTKYLGKKFSCKGETFTVVEEYAEMIVLSTDHVIHIKTFEQRVNNGTYKEVVK